MRTTFPLENEGFLDSRTNSAQIPQELTTPKMRFPKIVLHQKAEVTIYGKKKNYPFYRIIYRAEGKRRMQHFAKYSDALKAAEEKAEQLWKPRLTSVSIGNGVTEIGDSAFADCPRLANVTIGRSVTKIGDWAFSGCSHLA